MALNFGGALFEQSDVRETAVADIASTIVAPVGTVMAWLKSYTNTPQTLPSGWIECNGQTLSDSESVYDGQTIPDLNGDNRFLRGNSTSGGTGGSESGSHTHTINLPGTRSDTTGDQSGGFTGSTNPESTNSQNGGTENRPPFYDIVWIMRIK